MMTARPIEEAPVDGRWLLVRVPDGGGAGWAAPWLLGTRTDGGWLSEDGRAIRPTHFAELPDPQPLWSGWSPARGIVRIVPSPVGDAFPDAPWMIFVQTPDGIEDPHRRLEFAATITEARVRARATAERVNLPFEDVVDEAGCSDPAQPNALRDAAWDVDAILAFMSQHAMSFSSDLTPADRAFTAVAPLAEVVASIGPSISDKHVNFLVTIGSLLIANAEAADRADALARLGRPEGSA